MSKRVLITGGAGLIGSHIADQLIAQDLASEIVILDNLVRGRLENIEGVRQSGRVRLVEGDIRDSRLVNDVMQGIDWVFHQAAIRITQCAEEPRLALEVLVDGTFNVVDAAHRAGVKRLVAASSASAYGLAEKFPTSEDHHPYNNRTLYGAAKVFNEGLLRSYHDMYGFPYVALRYFNVYGPRMDIYGAYTEVLIRWMDRISEGESLLMFGDGMQTMDFVFVEDIARANVLAAQSDVTDEVFNIASGTETSLKDIGLKLMRAMHASVGIEHRPERKVNPVPRRLADTSKAKRLLGFETCVSLEEGLRRLVEWRAREKASMQQASELQPA